MWKDGDRTNCSLRRIVATTAKRKIFLSATPVFNKKQDFLNETNLLTQKYCITSSTKSVSKCLDFQPRIESILVELNQAERNLYNAVENVTSINQILTELTRNCFLDSPTHPQYTNTRAVCGSLFTAAAKQTRIFIWRKAT